MRITESTARQAAPLNPRAKLAMDIAQSTRLVSGSLRELGDVLVEKGFSTTQENRGHYLGFCYLPNAGALATSAQGTSHTCTTLRFLATLLATYQTSEAILLQSEKRQV